MANKKLTDAVFSCRQSLIEALLDFVRENGDECTDYEINEFGLDEESCGEGKVTRVYNFFDRNGCYFYEPQKVNDSSLNDLNEDNFYDKLYEGSIFTAYQCLYIVEDESGNERLKYYRFTNGGVNFDSDQAEPDHDFATTLPLLDLYYLIEAIERD